MAVRQLVEEFAKYQNLQRLAGPEVLKRTMEEGLWVTTWATEHVVRTFTGNSRQLTFKNHGSENE